MKVGDYVRTKYGIFKIRNITKDLGYNKREKRVLELDRNIPEEHYNFQFYKDQTIFKNAKFSPNIIDLIEVGDYVNENRVVNIAYLQDKVAEIYLDTNDLFEQAIYREEDIKSIVTKEQFESMEYKLGGKENE